MRFRIKCFAYGFRDAGTCPADQAAEIAEDEETRAMIEELFPTMEKEGEEEEMDTVTEETVYS